MTASLTAIVLLASGYASGSGAGAPAPALPLPAPDVDVAAVVCAPEYAWDCGWALATVWCESRNDPDAVNPAGPYRSWWQVLDGDLDPYVNTAQAYAQWLQWQRGERRVSPWPYCGRVAA